MINKGMWFEVSVVVHTTSKKKARERALEFLKDETFPVTIKPDKFLNKHIDRSKVE